MKIALAALVAAPALAIPRFAVRTGYDCSACHVNPTGGGMRSAYGRNVFARRWLAMVADEAASEPAFSPELGEHVALGADLRTGHLWQNSPDEAIPDTSTLFTPQMDLYLHARTGPKLALYLDLGVYGGFEAFALVRPLGEPRGGDLYVKAGRFVLPFGAREVNHTIWTRETVGFGPRDRDNAVELGLALGRLSAQIAIANGAYGDAFFDAAGTGAERGFDKAVAARLVFRARAGPLRAWHGASLLYNDNVGQQSPLFSPALFPRGRTGEIAQGVDEWRAGGFLGLGLGRLSWAGELVVVRDAFEADLRPLTGYTSYQELAAVILQGLDAVVTYEFADADVEFERGRVERVGGVVEIFPLRFLEIRAMVRHAFGPQDLLPGGARDDVEVFLHLFL